MSNIRKKYVILLLVIIILIIIIIINCWNHSNNIKKNNGDVNEKNCYNGTKNSNNEIIQRAIAAIFASKRIENNRK